MHEQELYINKQKKTLYSKQFLLFVNMLSNANINSTNYNNTIVIVRANNFKNKLYKL